MDRGANIIRILQNNFMLVWPIRTQCDLNFVYGETPVESLIRSGPYLMTAPIKILLDASYEGG